MWSDLIGKKLVAYRVPDFAKKSYYAQPSYLLFDDGKSIIRLEPQCSYDYHDCNPSARTIELTEDEKLWSSMFNKEGYREGNFKYEPFS